MDLSRQTGGVWSTDKKKDKKRRLLDGERCEEATAGLCLVPLLLHPFLLCPDQ